MEIIIATVNSRLLTKADRLFTGTLNGRIIELLQNARRAGATEVIITNEDGWVTVKDNGQGIEDFAKLLDLGGSGWDEACEESEDPAGVGIFCLAPREVTIRSKGTMVTITKEGWTSVPTEVREDPQPVREGAILRFQDEPWGSPVVDINAVFSGLQVIVDGEACPKEPFVSEGAAHYPELGCKIEVCESSQLNQWHNSCRLDRWYSNSGILNFHGQYVTFDYHPISTHGLHNLVDLTGEPTNIRLMLPARTCLVENEAYKKLLEAIELEAYRFIKRRSEHTLPYKEYLRAKELGINLPEAKPIFSVGLIGGGDGPEPVDVDMPTGFPLDKCYRFNVNTSGKEEDETNAHLLAALGKFDDPFIPVDIGSAYNGYSWAKLPTIDTVEVKMGTTLLSKAIWDGMLTCVDELSIKVETSDGKVFSSPVCMARTIPEDEEGSKDYWADYHMMVTSQAKDQIWASAIWYHLGGYNCDGDTYDTQEARIEEYLDRFWAELIGPMENFRQEIVQKINYSHVSHRWQSVQVNTDGRVQIRYEDGTEETLLPPAIPVKDAVA